MAAAWLLNQRHHVTVYEKDDRPGGHSNTVWVPADDGEIPVDTGFIVYNAVNYPNLVALFEHLGVSTKPSDMSFAVTLDDGALEYGGSNLSTLFAQRGNVVSPRFWTMLRDLLRFYREAPRVLGEPNAEDLTLGEYLTRGGYSRAFIDDHLLPMAAAIWSAPAATMIDHPAAAFVRFCENHGLLKIRGRPQWRTVAGGSHEYVRRLTAPYAAQIRLNSPVRRIRRTEDAVFIQTDAGGEETFDHVVVAAHADQALQMLADATVSERRLLGAFGYEQNVAVLHRDARLMPRRRRAWASWNYVGNRQGTDERVCVTYWMNRLQALPGPPLFVTVNPPAGLWPDRPLRTFAYEHPVFTPSAMRAQRALEEIQGERRTWYCGAHFGAGFHEDGLQAGLWVAEALGGLRRPWTVANESGRIFARGADASIRGAQVAS
jgi:predicted NAD/FAD-binding protein